MSVPIPPTTMVILGGTGNLAESKLLPALFDLYRHQVLPKRFTIIGLSRKTWSDNEYRHYARTALLAARGADATEALDSFLLQVHYSSGDFDSAACYGQLRQKLIASDERFGQCTNKLFYLAVPPQYYSGIFTQLAQSGVMALCNNVDSWSRLLVEKPFGRDLATAQSLEAQLCAQFAEEQIYRIDHYLAKDAIENILALRFGNRVLADSWQHTDIESIHIAMRETKDVSTRGSFYDGVGALRDVGQNHVLQVLALLTMPAVLPGEVAALRAARARSIAALRPPTEVVRGQYEGYRDTPGVAADSTTETYFRLVTELNLPEWSGVPITLEAGKALHEAKLEAAVIFRPRADDAAGPQNVLTITMSPEARITLRIFVKKPGFAFTLEPRDLELIHTPGVDDYSPEAYERVLYDCLRGDQTRFVSGTEVEAAWRFITPLLDAALPPPELYTPGSAGPKGA